MSFLMICVWIHYFRSLECC